MLKHSLLAGAIALAPLAAWSETIRATVVAGHPPVFRWVRVLPEIFEPAVNTALEGTDYQLEFDNQFGGSIAKVGEELETVGEGLAEIGTIQSLFDPAKLAVQNVTYYTPFVTDDPRAIQRLMAELHEEETGMQMAYEDENITYLGAPTVIDDYLLMTNFPVNSMADLEGRRIAAPGAAVNWLSGTGAVGVSGNLTTYYNEIQTGVYDGVLVFASAALPGKLYEVAPHITKLGLGAQFAGVIGANRDWYEGLPAEVQNALHTGADAAAEWYISDLESFVALAFEKMEDAGATIQDAPADMREQWAANMDNVAKAWATQLDGQGLPATEMLTRYMDGMRAAGATPLRDWDKE